MFGQSLDPPKLIRGKKYVNEIFEQNKDKNFVQRAMNPNDYQGTEFEGQPASHLMSYGEGDGKYYVYPRIIQKPGEEALTTLDPDEAYKYARDNNEFIEFDREDDAAWFSENYKKIWKDVPPPPEPQGTPPPPAEDTFFMGLMKSIKNKNFVDYINDPAVLEKAQKEQKDAQARQELADKYRPQSIMDMPVINDKTQSMGDLRISQEQDRENKYRTYLLDQLPELPREATRMQKIFREELSIPELEEIVSRQTSDRIVEQERQRRAELAQKDMEGLKASNERFQELVNIQLDVMSLMDDQQKNSYAKSQGGEWTKDYEYHTYTGEEETYEDFMKKKSTGVEYITSQALTGSMVGQAATWLSSGFDTVTKGGSVKENFQDYNEIYTEWGQGYSPSALQQVCTSMAVLTLDLASFDLIGAAYNKMSSIALKPSVDYAKWKLMHYGKVSEPVAERMVMNSVMEINASIQPSAVLGTHSFLLDAGAQIAEGKDFKDIDWSRSATHGLHSGILGLGLGLKGVGMNYLKNTPQMEKFLDNSLKGKLRKLGVNTLDFGGTVSVFTIGEAMLDSERSISDIRPMDWINTAITIGTLEGISSKARLPKSKNDFLTTVERNQLKEMYQLDLGKTKTPIMDLINSGKAKDVLSDPDVAMSTKQAIADVAGYKLDTGPLASAKLNESTNELRTYNSKGDLLEIIPHGSKTEAMESMRLAEVAIQENNNLKELASMSVKESSNIVDRMAKKGISDFYKDTEMMEALQKPKPLRTQEEHAKVNKFNEAMAEYRQEKLEEQRVKAEKETKDGGVPEEKVRQISDALERMKQTETYTDEDIDLRYEVTDRLRASLEHPRYGVNKTIEDFQNAIKSGEYDKLAATGPTVARVLGLPGESLSIKNESEAKDALSKLERYKNNASDELTRRKDANEPVFEEGKYPLGRLAFDSKEALFRELDKFKSLDNLPEVYDINTAMAVEEYQTIRNERSAKLFVKEPENAKAISDHIKDLAATVRKAKGALDPEPGTLQMRIPKSEKVWDASIEVIAKALEGGAKVTEAIQKGIEYLRGTELFKGLSRPKQIELENEFVKRYGKLTDDGIKELATAIDKSKIYMEQIKEAHKNNPSEVKITEKDIQDLLLQGFDPEAVLKESKKGGSTHNMKGESNPDKDGYYVGLKGSDEGRNQSHVTPENSEKFADMTVDKDGNFVFYHYSFDPISEVNPKKAGTNKKGFTSQEEVSAAGTVGGVSFYYTNSGLVESGVGKVKNTVVVPKEKVYDADADVLGFREQAEERFRKSYPDKAYGSNEEIFWVTKIATENGYDMTVTTWGAGGQERTRAQSVKSLTPSKEEVYPVEATELGYRKVSPVHAAEIYDNILLEINKYRSKEQNYDALHNAYSDYLNPKKDIYKDKEKITELVEESDLPNELKKRYRQAVEAVDVPGYSEKDLTLADIIEFAVSNKGLLSKNQDILRFGTWKGAMGISAHVRDLDKALEIGRKLNQEAIYDIKSGNDIVIKGDKGSDKISNNMLDDIRASNYIKEQDKTPRRTTPQRKIDQAVERERTKVLVDEYQALKDQIRTQSKIAEDIAKGNKVKAKERKEYEEGIRQAFNDFISSQAWEGSMNKRAAKAIWRRINNMDFSKPRTIDEAHAYIEKAVNDANFRAELAEYDKVLRNLDERTAPDRFQVKENNILKGKSVTQQTRDRLSDIRRAMFEGDPNKAALEIDKLFEKIETEGRDFTPEEYQRLENLQFEGLMSLSHPGNLEYYKNRVADINDIVSKGRTQWQARRIAEAERIRGITENTSAVLNAGSKQVDLDADFTKNNLSKFRKALQVYDLSHDSWFSLLDKLSRYDKTSNPMESFLNQHFGEMYITQESKHYTSKKETMDVIIEGAEKTFGSDYKNTLKHNAEVEHLAYIDPATGKSRMFTLNEAYKRWMEMQDPTLRPSLTEMGYYDKDGNPTAKAEGIERLMNENPKVKEWAEYQLNELYPKLLEKYNPAYLEMFGTNIPQRPGEYSPISVDAPPKGQNAVDAMMDNMNFRGIAGMNHMKARVNHKRALQKMDGDAVLSRYVDQMEFFNAWGKAIQEMNRVFRSPEVAKSIEQNFGPAYSEAVDYFLRRMAHEPQSTFLLDRMMTTIRKNFTIGSLAFKPVVAIKQLTSFPAYAANIPVVDFMKGLADFVTNYSEAVKTMNAIPFMQERGSKGWDRDIELLMKQDLERMSSSGSPKFTDVLMYLTKWGDRAAIYLGGWSVYKYHYDRAMAQEVGEAEARRIAELRFVEATRSSQQASSPADLSIAQNSHPMYKLLTMYKTSPMQYHRKVMEGARNLYYGRGSKAENWKKIAIYHVLLPSLFQMVGNGFKWDGKDQLRAAVAGNLNALFLAGDVGNILIDKLIMKNPYDYQLSPVGTLPNDIVKTFQDMKQLINMDEITLADFLDETKNLSTVIGHSTGVPTKGVHSTLSGVVDAISGRTEYPARRILGWSEGSLSHAGKKKDKDETFDPLPMTEQELELQRLLDDDTVPLSTIENYYNNEVNAPKREYTPRD